MLSMRVIAVLQLNLWAGMPPLPTWHHHRHRPLQLNFLDDYKAEEGEKLALLPDPNAEQFIHLVNNEHMEELRQVARMQGTLDGVDWSVEELTSVEVTTVDDRGMLLREVLCSANDQRCIGVDVHIPWPPNMPMHGRQLPAMRTAFTEISRRAYAATFDNDGALPPEYQMQQMACNPLMSLMNAEFGKLLRFYALKHAREALSQTEQVEQAKLMQLTFEGLSLELTTLDVGTYSLEFGESVTRQTWSTSILFANRCQSADEVENMLVQMFDNTAAAVEEGRIDVEGVAPEPVSEMIANAEKESEQEDARTASFRSRDRRLRRAVRTRRMVSSNRATARYIAASRRWPPTSSSTGD